MTIGINTSPLAGQEGTSMTARLVKNRLDAELVGNVSIRVLPTERPDTWEVQGRGELQLAVLVEMMRREGFELTVGKPQVLTREIDGVVHEPVDRLTVDVPEEFMGVITQLLALRKGRMEQIVNHGTGWVRLDYLVPARGLIGFRTELLTETRGTALLHHVFECYEPWAGTIRARTRGSLVADRLGPTTGYSLMSLQERGQLFVGPGEVVYEGMIVGENARADDMDVNPTKEKKLTNMRSNADTFEKLIPPRPMSLEQALEFIADDECVEVTPRSVRLRKVVLRPDRARPRRQAGQGRRGVGLSGQLRSPGPPRRRSRCRRGDRPARPRGGAGSPWPGRSSPWSRRPSPGRRRAACSRPARRGGNTSVTSGWAAALAWVWRPTPSTTSPSAVGSAHTDSTCDRPSSDTVTR